VVGLGILLGDHRAAWSLIAGTGFILIRAWRNDRDHGLRCRLLGSADDEALATARNLGRFGCENGRVGGARASSRTDRPANDLGRDEEVFGGLVTGWSSTMLRLALAHVPTRAVAEEVVQEAWLVVLRDFRRFERRSAFRTWVLGIVVNIARSRARSERRSIPVPVGDEHAVDGARFESPDSPSWPDHWAVPPVAWPTPEDALLAGEVRGVILAAVAGLPPAQQEVLVLRDLEGASAEETCNVLGLTDTNQRVLLHRARSRVRNAIEQYFLDHDQ
jgi:RNA polymerase sigma-70 factor, ECF subfamily